MHREVVVVDGAQVVGNAQRDAVGQFVPTALGSEDDVVFMLRLARASGHRAEPAMAVQDGLATLRDILRFQIPLPDGDEVVRDARQRFALAQVVPGSMRICRVLRRTG